ncbi:Acid sphingomyelinase-like phosphodiesterase 3b, variant 2 [Chamberlinius hualienensis]
MSPTYSFTQIGYFWHVTDIHWDKNYTNHGGNPRNMCWVPPSTEDNHDLVRSTNDVGEFGNYACDSPWKLCESVLEFMKTKEPNADFIVWTGDDDSHVSDYFFSPTKVRTIMDNMTHYINLVFPNTPVIPTFGNHDAFPKSAFPTKTFSPWYEEIADLWKHWLGEEAYLTFKKGGYYQMPHPTVPNVTLIGLNTPLYYQKNRLVQARSNPDPLDQFAWLDKTLTQLEASNKKAYLLAHISPGIFGRKVTPNGYRWFQDTYNIMYHELIVKHAKTIIGQFYGHDHTDSFKLYYDIQGNPVNLHLVAPAVTPWNTTLPGIGPNNPGVRLVKYDLQTGEILNYYQYYLNLSEANVLHKANWTEEYNFLDAYNLTDMSPQNIDRLVQGFANSDTTYFNKYYEYNSVSYTSANNCDEICRKNHYCAITKVDYSAFVDCNNPERKNTTDNNENVIDNGLHIRRLVARGPLHQILRR